MLDEVDFFNGHSIKEGDFLYVPPARRAALLDNPYLESHDTVCQWVGFADGKPAGFNYSFPINVWADGKVYGSTTGSCLNVSEWARKTDLGLVLPAKGVESASKDGIAIAASCSQMAVPLHKVNGYKFFYSPRYIALRRCRSVLEMFLPKWLLRPIAFCGDLLLWIYFNALSIVASKLLRGYVVMEVQADDEDGHRLMSDIVAKDLHRFREDHDSSWFKWHMTKSFSEDGPCCGYLLKSRTEGQYVAFGLTKRRFHKQASRRGFRNVWLFSIMEWGALPGHETNLKGLVLALILKGARNCDAIEFSTDDETLGKFVRRIGLKKVGESNVGVKVMKKFPLYGDKSIKEQSNWRIRPGMGDNALS